MPREGLDVSIPAADGDAGVKSSIDYIVIIIGKEAEERGKLVMVPAIKEMAGVALTCSRGEGERKDDVDEC